MIADTLTKLLPDTLDHLQTVLETASWEPKYASWKALLEGAAAVVDQPRRRVQSSVKLQPKVAHARVPTHELEVDPGEGTLEVLVSIRQRGLNRRRRFRAARLGGRIGRHGWLRFGAIKGREDDVDSGDGERGRSLRTGQRAGQRTDTFRRRAGSSGDPWAAR